MSPSQPLLLFNDGSALHVLDPVTRNFVGSLAGHGGVCPLPQQAGRVLTNSAAHNICRCPSEATTLFLYNGEGFHHTNIRSHTTGEAAAPQPHMATPEVWTKGRVSETRFQHKFGTVNGASFHRILGQLPGFTLLRPRVTVPDCARLFWPGGDLEVTRPR